MDSDKLVNDLATYVASTRFVLRTLDLVPRNAGPDSCKVEGRETRVS